MSSHIKASIFIPTYNGEKYLNEILKMIFRQVVDFEYEVLIIDSGSKDRTLDIVEKYRKEHPKQLQLIEIDNSEFGHGKTRNRAAELSKGDFMVYLSHDAVPSNKHWLYEMVKPFELNEKVMGVVGKQVPRPKCVPLLKYEIRSVFKAFGPEYGTTLFYKDTFMRGEALYNATSFYSDVNSAVRRNFLLNEIPYRDVRYAEDYMFGKDLIDAGYLKAYASRGEVIHSNDLSLGEYKHRIFDETVGLRNIGRVIKKPSLKHVVKMIVVGVFKDWVRIVLDRQYSFKRKVFWFLVNPFYHIEKWRGFRLAAKINLQDERIINKYSLERLRNK